MASRSLQRWETERARVLDQVEAAHRSLGGYARGRRYTTQQLNRAYTLLLSSQFQGFCRDLHSEAVDHIASSASGSAMQSLLRAALTQGRKLDKGNPNPGNLGADFGRLDLAFWDAVRRADLRNVTRRQRLEDLNEWRNAIAHDDFDAQVLGRSTLRLDDVRTWRGACKGLARSFDRVLSQHIRAFAGRSPW